MNMQELIAKLSPILLKKIPLFSQTIGEFGGKKTNYGGMAMIALGIYLLTVPTGADLGAAFIGFGFAALGIRDAQHKDKAEIIAKIDNKEV